jgi:hypothetical protein
MVNQRMIISNQPVEDAIMAGLKLLTKFDAQTCLKIAWRTAQEMGFSLTPLDESSRRFTASKGNIFTSILGGPFAPNCNFKISVEDYPSANEVVLEKQTAWLFSGAIGVGKVNRQAEELLSAIASAIEKEGGNILERKEF